MIRYCKICTKWMGSLPLILSTKWSFIDIILLFFLLGQHLILSESTSQLIRSLRNSKINKTNCQHCSRTSKISLDYHSILKMNAVAFLNKSFKLLEKVSRKFAQRQQLPLTTTEINSNNSNLRTTHSNNNRFTQQVSNKIKDLDSPQLINNHNNLMGAEEMGKLDIHIKMCNKHTFQHRK